MANGWSHQRERTSPDVSLQQFEYIYSEISSQMNKDVPLEFRGEAWFAESLKLDVSYCLSYEKKFT